MFLNKTIPKLLSVSKFIPSFADGLTSDHSVLTIAIQLTYIIKYFQSSLPVKAVKKGNKKLRHKKIVVNPICPIFANVTAPKSKPRRTCATKDKGSGVGTVGKFFGIQNNSNAIFPKTANLMEIVLSDQSTSIQFPGATAVPTNKRPTYADKAKAKPSVSPEEVSSTVR